MQADSNAATDSPETRARSNQVARIKDDFGLLALGFFGIGLMSAAFLYHLQGRGDLIDLAAAVSIGLPGLAAMAMAGYGLLRPPR
jgi:hypothetical protein